MEADSVAGGTMNIAGHTMGTPEYTLEEALRLFSRIGLEGAELVVQDGYPCGLPERAGQPLLRDLRSLADDLGIRVIALTPYVSRFNDPSALVRKEEIGKALRVIDYARELGAEYIRIYGGNFSSGEEDRGGRMRRHLVESMRILAEAAGSAGVFLAIENHFNTMTVSAKESIAISSEIGSPSVGILYDQANLTFTGNEPYEEAIDLQIGKILYTHVKDFDFLQGKEFSSSDVSHPAEEERNVVTRIVGRGCLDWPGILKLLDRRGYTGWLSLEYERRWHPKDIPDAALGMKESARFLRECLATLRS